jgi:hypothetical protein
MKKRIKPESGWAIHGPHGFYYGWHGTMAGAIAEHVDALYGLSERNSKLSDEQKRAWRECRDRGHRAVKVRISQRQR